MFDPLDEDKKGKYDPWWFTVNISQYMIIYFFYENKKKWSKGFVSWWLLRKKTQHILHIELGHGGYLLQKYEFCKMPAERNERGKKFIVWYFFLHFLRIFALGPFLLIRLSWQNTSSYIFIFHIVTSPLHSNILSWPSLKITHPHLLINDWSHRSCSFLNILLF